MPLYEYSCDRCKKIIEIIQKFSDPPIETCPDCNSKVEKIMSLSAFALKGQGWYVTDYKRPVQKNSNPKAETTKTEKATPSSGSDSKS